MCAVDTIDPWTGAVTTVHQIPCIRPARGYLLRDRSPCPAELHLTEKKRSGGSAHALDTHTGTFREDGTPPQPPPAIPPAQRPSTRYRRRARPRHHPRRTANPAHRQTS